MILTWVALAIGSIVSIMIFLRIMGLDVDGADEKLAMILADAVVSIAMPLSAVIFAIPLGIRWSRLIGKLPKLSELLYGLESGLPLIGGGIFLRPHLFWLPFDGCARICRRHPQ